MVTRATALVAAVLIGGVGVVAGVQAQESKIQKKDLPAAVQKAMESEVQGSTVKGFAKEIEDGKTFYEVETTKNGHTRDLLFDPSGSLVEVEEEVALDSLPAAVKSALSGQGKLLKVESVTKGTTTVYEGHIEKGGKKSEVKVTPDGKPVTP
jgi:uncharacterized membrane protein YkoI